MRRGGKNRSIYVYLKEKEVTFIVTKISKDSRNLCFEEAGREKRIGRLRIGPLFLPSPSHPSLLFVLVGRASRIN